MRDVKLRVSFGKILANVLIMLAILFLSSVVFPQYYQFDSPWVMIEVALLHGVASTAVALAVVTMTAMLLISFHSSFKAMAMVVFIAAILVWTANLFGLIVLNRYIDGFVISGFWPTVALAIAKSIATPTDIGRT